MNVSEKNYKRKILICSTVAKRFCQVFCLIKYPENCPGLLFSVVNWKLISKVLWVGRKTFCCVFGNENCEIVKIGSHHDCLIAFSQYQINYSNRKDREELQKENKPTVLIQNKILRQ